MATIPASKLYAIQNKILHKAFGDIGMPWEEFKTDWADTIRSICRRDVTGLSDMTLTERSVLIDELMRGGAAVKNFSVPKRIGSWKKGDPDDVPKSRDLLLGKIEALKADLDLTDNYLNGIVKKMFRVDSYRFCSATQLVKLTAALSYRQKKVKGRIYKG